MGQQYGMPLNKSEQEKMFANPGALHDLATSCFVDYGFKYGFNQDKIRFNAEYITAWLRSVCPDADDEQVYYAERQIRQILRERVESGIINAPDI
jgi:hypothetical protein